MTAIPPREIIPGVPMQPLVYEAYREQAQDCDVLLWAPTSLRGLVIAAATGGPFCHVSAALWWRKRLMDVGYQEWQGGRAKPLRTLIKKHPGACHAFRVKLTNQQRHAVGNRLVDELSGKYNWGGVRLVMLSWIFRLTSQAGPLRKVVQWARRGGEDRICSRYLLDCYAPEVVFSHREPALVTPNDIGYSSAVEYLGTLI